MIIKDIKELEDKKIPKGCVTLVGLGRLGFRIGLNLIQVHRGGPKKIIAIDGQKISESDIIFKLYGGKIGEYKVEFLKSICAHPENLRNVLAIKENITANNLNLIEGDVVSIQIAGGNTLPLASIIIKKAQEIGAKTISTAGVFGIGKEEIKIRDISDIDDNNPIVNELRAYGIKKNHIIITTSKYIEDNLPITPYVLDTLSKIMTIKILELLD